MSRKRPFQGKAILVTRAKAQGHELKQSIEERGGDAILLPCIAFRAKHDKPSVQQFRKQLHRADWLILTSANGARFCHQFMQQADLSLPPELRVATIGQKTRQTAERLGIPVHFAADALDSRDFVRLFMENQELPYRVFYPTSRQAHDVLEKEFNKFGVDVMRQDIYETVPIVTEDAIERAFQRRIDAVTFFSPSAVHAFMVRCPFDIRQRIKTLPVFSIGSTTSAALAESGLKHIFTAARPGLPQMISLMEEIFSEVDQPTGDG